MKGGIAALITSLLVLLHVTAWGAMPAQELIKYSQTSGSLTPGDTYQIRFSLWDSEETGSGTMVWSEEKAITVADNNTITTKLGSVNPLLVVEFSEQYWYRPIRRPPPAHTR